MAKIAVITPALNYGGGEKQVEFLALGLKPRGHSVTVYCFTGGGKIADTLKSGGIKVVPLYSRLLSKLGASGQNRRGVSLSRAVRMLNEFCAAVKLFFALLADRPSVVHLYQNQTKMAIIAAKAAGVKRIIYTETSSIGDWMSPAQLSVMRFFWKKCDAIMVLSEAMKLHMIKLKAASADSIHVAPTMLPAQGIIQKSRGHGKERRIAVGTIGRLAPEKGHVYFLQAAGLIAKDRSDVEFLVAGDGHLKDELISEAGRLGLRDKMEFTGPFRDISDIMERIDILALSSLTEGMPLVLLEGMAYGKPIVATDVGGVSELVLNGTSGLVVAPKDPRALADAILLLADDPQKRETFARASRARFEKTYSSDIVIPMIEKIYAKDRSGKQSHR